MNNRGFSGLLQNQVGLFQDIDWGFSMVFGIYLGLGVGGMERMSLYAALLWLMGFGAQLAK